MALSFVQAPTAIDSSGTSANFGAITTTANDLLIAFGRWGGQSLTPGFVRTGDSFVEVQAKYEDSQGDTLWTAAAKAIAAGTNTISMTSSTSVSLRGNCFELGGCDLTAPVDKVSTWKEVIGAGTTESSNSSGTTAQADEILIGLISSQGLRTFTAADSYTKPTNGSSTKTAMEYKIVSAVGDYTCTWTLDTALDNLALQIVTLKMAGGAPPPNKFFILTHPA